MTTQLFWTAANIASFTGSSGTLAAETPRILRADLVSPDGTPTTTTSGQTAIVNPGVAGLNLLGITIDPVNRRIYYVDISASGNILVANLDGSSPFVAVASGNATGGGSQSVRDVALDLTNNRIYWVVTDTVAGGDNVRYQSLNASGIGTGAVTTVSLPSDAQTNPTAIALDVPNGHFYIADRSGAGGRGIVRYNLDGTNATIIISTFGPNEVVNDLAIGGGKIYYSVITATGTTDGVRRANLDGSNNETILNDIDPTAAFVPFNNPSGIALDLVNNKIYVSDNVNDIAPNDSTLLDDIYQANLDGTGFVRTISDTVRLTRDIDIFVTPTINLSVPDPNAAETGGNTGTFRITRNGDLGNPLPVTYTISGSATSGADYTALSGSATILAGQTFVDITVTPSSDGVPNEGTELVSLTLSSSQIYDLGTTTGDVSIADTVVVIPTVNLSVSANAGSEANSTIITVTATASSAVTGNQTVNLGVTGTGIAVGDYTLSNNVIVIANGQTTGSVTFTIVNDALVEGTETATLTIRNPSSGITLGGTTTQNLTITDNDFAIVDISINNGSGDGGGDGNTSSFTGNPSGVPGQVQSTDVANSATFNIFESELEGLSASTNILLRPTGNITIQDIADNTLSLVGTGPVNLIANSDNVSPGSFTMNTGDQIVAAGRVLNISGVGITAGSLNTSTLGATNGGAIWLSSSNGGISVSGIESTSSGNGASAGNGGAVTINSIGGAVNLTGQVSAFSFTNSANPGNTGAGGNITVTSSSDITSVAGNFVSAFNTRSVTSGNVGSVGNGGAIQLTSGGNISISGTQFTQGIFANSNREGSGAVVNTADGGAVTINSAGSVNFEALFFSTVSRTGTGSTGNGGNVSISSNNDVSLILNGGVGLETQAETNEGNTENGGEVTISSATGNVTAPLIRTYARSGNGTIGSGGDVNLSSAVTLITGAINTNDIPGNIGNIAYGNITLTGNEINFPTTANSIVGTNRNLILQPSSANQTIAIGSADSGNVNVLDITATDLAAIRDGFSQITIGRSDATGFININSNVNFSDPILLRTPNGQININATVSLVDNAVFNYSASVPVQLNSGGAIVLNSSNQIDNSVDFNLNGGALTFNGFNETADLLQVSSNSSISFGNGSSAIAFSNSSNQTWTGILTINNWSNSSGETLRFGTNASGLTSSQLAQIQFAGFNIGAQIDSLGFVTPPTPTVNLSISPSSGSEAAQTSLTVTLTATAPVVGNQTVNLALSGTGITPSDFTGTIPSSLTILNGQTQTSFTVNVLDDTNFEGAENAVFTISNPSSGLILGNSTSSNFPISDNDSSGGSIGNGDSTGNVIVGTANTDRLNGGAGDDTITGAGGRDIIFGGLGADIFNYNALTDSLVTAPDRLATFNQPEGDRFRLTPTNPDSLSNAGTISAATLSDAVVLAFADANQVTPGNQALVANGALLFTFSGRTYLAINDAMVAFGSASDLVTEVLTFTYAPGDSAVGTLTPANYFG